MPFVLAASARQDEELPGWETWSLAFCQHKSACDFLLHGGAMLGAARRQSSLLHVRSCARSFLSTRVGRTAEEIIAGVLTRALEEVKREETRQHTRGVLKEEQLYEWQRTILEMVTQQQAHDRHIYWYYDEGNSGKSALAKLLVTVHGAVMCEDRAVDIKHTVAKHAEEKGKCPTTIIFNQSTSIRGQPP